MEYPVVFSPSTMGFYPVSMKQDYLNAGSWPEDGIGITQEEYLEFNVQYPDGKVLGAVDGKIAWIDAPAPSKEQLINEAMSTKQYKIESANKIFMEWQTKLLLDMASESEKDAVRAWVKYVDEIKSLDVSTAPDIDWPVEPPVPDEAK